MLATSSVTAFQTSNPSVSGSKIIQPVFRESPSRIPNILPFKNLKRPKVALVLSGGGARGVAAIGVIKTLEKLGISVDFIGGTSVGSIVGGLYASGYSTQQLQRMVDTTNWNDVLSFNDDARRSDLFLDQKQAKDKSILTVRFEKLQPIIPQSFSTGQRLTNFLNLLSLQGIYHPNPSFDNLRIPFRAVATDLVSGKMIVIDKGDLTEAMRASMSVPLLFSPVARDTTRLLDGGLVSNIPVDVAREWGADIVIAVDVTSPLRPAANLNAPWEIADQLMGIMMQSAIKEQLAKADIVIRPTIGNHLSNDFTGLDSLIQQGEESALHALKELQSLLAAKSFQLMAATESSKVFSNAKFQFDALSLEQDWLTKIMSLARKSDIAEQEVRALVTAMYRTGDFERAEVSVTENPDGSVLQLHAELNPILKSVKIEGTRYLSADSLLEIFQPLLGHRINLFETQKAMEAVLAEYRDRGYSLARIRDTKFDRASGTATILIDEGMVYRRDIRGTEKTKDYIIWRELPWEEKDVFQVSKVSEGIANLYGTNLFEQVSVNVEEEGEQGEHLIVVIKVKERSTELIRFGMKVDNERNIIPSIDIRNENLFGVGAELGVNFSGGARNRSALAEFKATRIFNSYLTFNLKGYYTYRDVNVYADEPVDDPLRWNRIRSGEYRELRQGGSITFGTQLERLGTVTVETRLESHRIWSFSGPSFPTQSYRIASVKLGTKIDNLDRFPFPRNGIVMNFFYESSLLPLKKDVSFTKMLFTYEIYQTHFKRNTLHPKIVFGYADETLPLSEQFSLGGQQSFFGLREDNSRGRQLFVVSLEYRYESPLKIFFDTYLKARYDFGSIWELPRQIRLEDLRHGIGVGLAFDTPIGPAEFSVGRSFFIRNDLFNNPLSFGPVLGYFSIGYEF
ncbi:MAG: BamA/TamA family outer membrane protein [Ignavibacteriales bacterium]|nr:BamA/TamA family outer membrane protein [Ignavibacteriales bacterium]